MRSSPLLPLLRELTGACQAFEAYSSAHVRSMSLTPAQFDIVATLGNTPGMSPKELGERTLITKGTLTGVIDRLVAKKIVRRSASPSDGRCQVIQLTTQGEKLFARVFPAHVAYLQHALAGFPAADMAGMAEHLRLMKTAFAAARVARRGSVIRGRKTA